MLNSDHLFRLGPAQGCQQSGQNYCPKKAACAELESEGKHGEIEPESLTRSEAGRAVCFPLCLQQDSLAAGLGEALTGCSVFLPG